MQRKGFVLVFPDLGDFRRWIGIKVWSNAVAVCSERATGDLKVLAGENSVKPLKHRDYEVDLKVLAGENSV